MSLELKKYIENALEKGATRDGVLQTLSTSGWSESVVRKTLDQYAGVDEYGVPIPAPRMQAHQVARDLFFYLLILVTLSMSACALGGLLFDIINQFVPDTAERYHHSSAISWAIAQLVVAFPVFSLLSRLIYRDIAQHPEKRESLIRKLMIYFVLAITAVVGLGDLVAVLYNFLEGDLTIRFMLKAGVVLGISLLIFVYYLFEMRRDDATVKASQAKGAAP